MDPAAVITRLVARSKSKVSFAHFSVNVRPITSGSNIENVAELKITGHYIVSKIVLLKAIID